MANSNQGETRSNSKLTEEKVLEMRRLHKTAGVGKKKLSKMFGVSQSVAHRVIKNETWTHVGSGDEADS